MPDIISSTTINNKIDEQPCKPGTPIVLEGIIWQETNRGNERERERERGIYLFILRIISIKCYMEGKDICWRII
jgi:hypothetical protein